MRMDRSLSDDIIDNDNIYSDIFEKSHTAIAVLNSNAEISMVNNAFCLECGYSKEELIGTKWSDKLPNEEFLRLKEYNKKRNLGEPNIPQKYEAKYINKNKELRTALFSVSYIESSQKTIISFIDITEQKENESTIAESEFFFKESQRAANIGSYKVSFKTGTWESSAILDNILGIDENYERTIEPGWLNILHPDDREFMQNYLQKIVLGQQKPFIEEYRIIRISDGTIRWVSGHGKIILDNEKRPSTLIGTIQDITDRKLAEQAIHENQIKLNVALKIARLGSWELNLAENLFYFNDTFYSIFKSSSEKVGKNTMSPQEYSERFVYPDDRMVVAYEVERALSTDDPNYTRQIEHRMLYENGEVGYIAVRFTIVKDEKGNTIKLFGTNQDITAIRAAENKLKENESRLLELNSMKDRFFSIISHDLRGPFSAIIGLTQMLVCNSKIKDFKDVEKYAKLILNSSKKSMDLLTNLLEWSKSETGRIQYKPQKLLLFDLVTEIVTLLAPNAVTKNIHIKKDIPYSLIAFADASMLNTIIRNLVSNAIKFSFRNRTITISARELENMIHISITDSGIGIPAKTLKKLFRIDENISTKGTENEEGTGLGLILCKEYVDKHNGKIWVNSQEGKGSVFNFTIEKYINPEM